MSNQNTENSEKTILISKNEANNTQLTALEISNLITKWQTFFTFLPGFAWRKVGVEGAFRVAPQLPLEWLTLDAGGAAR